MRSLLSLSAIAAALATSGSAHGFLSISPSQGNEPLLQDPESVHKPFFSRQDAIAAVRERETPKGKPIVPKVPHEPSLFEGSHHASDKAPVSAVLLRGPGHKTHLDTETPIKIKVHKKLRHDQHQAEAHRPEPTFTGFQIGPVMGYSITDAKLISPDTLIGMTPKGFNGGGVVSLIYAFKSQLGNPAVGLDGAYIASWAKSQSITKMNANPTIREHPNEVKTIFQLEEKNSWFAAARFGIALKKVMPYLRFGYGGAEYDGKALGSDSGSPYSNAQKLAEVVAGTMKADGTDGYNKPGKYTFDGAQDSGQAEDPSGNPAAVPPAELAGVEKTPGEKDTTPVKKDATVKGPVFGIGVDLLLAEKFVMGLSANYFHLGDKVLPTGERLSFNKWTMLISATLKL